MLSISPPAFCRVCGVSYPESSPSIGDLLSSLSSDDTRICHGRMVSLFGFPPSVSSNAEMSLKASVRSAQEFYRQFESDLSLLLFQYLNVDWNGVDTENWWWSEEHTIAFESLRSEARNVVLGARSNMQYLRLLSFWPDEQLRSKFQQAISFCLSNLLSKGRSNQINNALGLVFSLPRVKTSDDFLIGVINRMLLAFDPKPEVASPSLEIKAVRSLLVAIIDRDLAGAEAALEAIGLPKPTHGPQTPFSNDLGLQRESWQSIFERRFNVEVDWWRNKDTF